jgi:hypothetical protein
MGAPVSKIRTSSRGKVSPAPVTVRQLATAQPAVVPNSGGGGTGADPVPKWAKPPPPISSLPEPHGGLGNYHPGQRNSGLGNDPTPKIGTGGAGRPTKYV